MEKISAHNSLKPVSFQKKTDQKMEQAAKDFEQILVANMLKAMNKNLGKTGFLDNGPYESMFRDMLIDERAKQIVETGEFGLAKQILKQTAGQNPDSFNRAKQENQPALANFAKI